MSAKPQREDVKYCRACLKSKIHTAAEWYGDIQLDYCSYHYWLMRGRDAGGVKYSLKSYIEASRLHAFRTSLPSEEAMTRMGED